MKIIFHTYTLNYRGTAVAVYDYAKYNQEVLGNESVILYKSSHPYEKDVGNEDETLNFIKDKFEVRSYTNDYHIDEIAQDCDLAYFIKYGFNDSPMPKNIKTAIHAVFQAKDPHGDRYAYISEWLAKQMGGDIPFVPHIVDLPSPTECYREKFGISKEQIIVGRYGGYYTFDLPFVKQEVINILEKDDRYVFLFVNTEPFIKHDRVKYIAPIVDRQKKSNFINTCDVMLHARHRGESFGLSICEFLFHNKPVLAWNNGLDQNHIHLLKDFDCLYDETNLLDKLKTVDQLKTKDWKSIVKQFEPTTVINKFKEVFID